MYLYTYIHNIFDVIHLYIFYIYKIFLIIFFFIYILQLLYTICISNNFLYIK